MRFERFEDAYAAAEERANQTGRTYGVERMADVYRGGRVYFRVRPLPGPAHRFGSDLGCVEVVPLGEVSR